MISRGEDEFTLNHDTSENSVDEETLETSDNETSSADTDDFVDSEDHQTLPPNEPISLSDLLDNPSISTHPQVPSQVELDSVQNLDAVFDTIYNEAQSGSVVPPRHSSSRLAAKPKVDYRALHRGNN